MRLFFLYAKFIASLPDCDSQVYRQGNQQQNTFHPRALENRSDSISGRECKIGLPS